jgi:GAF domain-containing protein
MDAQDLIKKLSQIGRHIQTPQEFIVKGMPLLVEALAPLAEQLRFYRAVPEGLILVASTNTNDQSRDIITYDEKPTARQALEASEVTVDPQNTFVLAPIEITSPQDAILEVQLSSQGSLEYGRPFLREQVGTVGQLFQFLLSDAIKTWALEKLTTISTLLNQAEDYEGVVKILGQYLVTRGQFISINLFDYDLGGEPKGFWVVATGSREHVATPNLYLAMEEGDVQNLAPLQQNQDVVLYNVPSVPIGAVIRKILTDAHVRAFHVVPLQVTGRTIGFISTHDTRLLLANLDAEQRVVRGLSGQVGAIVDNRRLLSETDSSLVEMRALYEATRRLMGAQTLHEVAQIIYDTFAKPDGRVSVMEYRYDENGHVSGAYVRYVVADGQGVEVERPMHVGYGDDERQLMQTRTADMSAEITFVENIAQDWGAVPTLVEKLAALNIASIVSLALSDGTHRKHQIDISWSQPRTFGSGQRRLYTAINAQVQIIYKNQSYLTAMQTNATAAERQVRALRLLNDLNAMANGATEENAFLQEISPLLMQVFQADNVAYSALEAKRQVFTLNFTYPPRELPAEIRVFQSPDIEFSENVAVLENLAELKVDENLRRIYEIYNMQTQMLLPLVDAQKNLMGVIGIGYERITLISDEMRELARTFVAQINLGLQKMNLLNRSQRQAQQMEQLALLSQSVQAVLDETTILRTVLRELRRVLPYDYLTVLLVQGDAPLVQAAYATPAESVIVPERKPYDLTKDAIAKQAWDEQGVAHADNVRRTWSWEHPLRASLGSIVAVPLFMGGRALGLIEVGSAAVYAYSETDVTALLQVGNQIALALENARDLERTERLARNRALANRISTVMQEQMDVETILQAALKEVSRAIGARHARIRLGPQETGPQS